MSDLSYLRVPAWCPVCKGKMVGKSTNTFYDWGCCIMCFINFIEGSEARVQRWKSGWRPTQEEIDLHEVSGS